MLETIALNYVIPLAYISFGVAALGAIVFPLVQMFQDLKKAITAFVAIGIIIVIFFVCYAFAAAEPHVVGDQSATAGQMKFLEAGIFLTYALFAGTFVAIIYSSVSRYFK